MSFYGQECKTPIVGFDMGGTSTDVSRFDGNYEHVYETTTAGITIQAPQVTNINIELSFSIVNYNIELK